MEERTGLLEAPRRYERILGRLTGVAPGPSVIAMTGIHGNEETGVRAAQRVLARLDETRPTISGEILILAGNLRALEGRSRFIDLDLNRQWTPQRLEAAVASAGSPHEPVEHGEQRELLMVIRDAIARARGPLYFLDHHTSSADGSPFVTIGDTLRNRVFASAVPLPLILGLEEQVDGALLEMLNNHGFVTMGVEGGRHDDERSVDRHESVLWLALVAAGVLREEDAPDLASHRARLREASEGVPRVIEVRHRHAITPEDDFRMVPGFDNFRRIEQGELLAHDRGGPIRSPESGLILLPLYQGLGDDGFFVSREVNPVWLAISAALRRLNMGTLMRFLPGVRRDPADAEGLIVNTNVARIYPLEIFHLFGFRKVRAVGDRLQVSRRRHDLRPPERINFG